MITMSGLSYDQQLVFRSTGQVKSLFDRLVVDLRSSGRLRFNGKKATREAVANAMILHFATMDPAFVAEVLAPHVARLEAILRGEKPADESPPTPRVTVYEDMPAARPSRRRKAGD